MEPLLFSEEWLKVILSLHITLTGLMIASASFLMGYYLKESRKIGINKRINFFAYLILSLIIVPLCLTISISLIIAISNLCLQVKIFLVTMSLSPIIPILTFLIILWKIPESNSLKSDRGD